MATLQLAENGGRSYGGEQFYQSLADSPKDLYLFVPNDPSGSDGVWVREDYFDNLPADQWQKVMITLDPYQPKPVNGIFSNIKANIQERRDRRDLRRDARTERVVSGQTFGQRLVDTVGGIFGKDQQTAPVDQRTGIEFGYTDQPAPKPLWQNPFVIVGGLGLLGLGVYALAKNSGNKKKK